MSKVIVIHPLMSKVIVIRPLYLPQDFGLNYQKIVLEHCFNLYIISDLAGFKTRERLDNVPYPSHG